MKDGQVRQVAEGVYMATGSDVNWGIIADGDALTLVDAGYPGDVRSVEDSIREVGRRPEHVRAVRLTHAHVDHMGALAHFARAYGTLLYTSADILRQAWRPSVLGWSLRAARAGGTKHLAADNAQPFPSGGALDLPGQPVPVLTPGHTTGHVAYHLPDKGVLFSGDALVTAHPKSRVRRPQLLPCMFAHDPAEAATSLNLLGQLDGDVLIPGHGPVLRGTFAEAVAEARERR